MKKDNLYIIVPAYNEEENIENVTNEWYEIIEKIGNESKLVIINDGSKDNTLKKLLELKKEKENLIVLDKKNGGHGDTILYGYKYALDNKADYIFQTDSDGQTIPEEFWDFWNEREEHDAIIGYRDERKDGIARKIITKVLRLVLFLIFHCWITDANTPFRLMKREILEKYFKCIPEHFNLSNVMLSVLMISDKCDVEFKHITFRPRQGGVNSINIRKITKIGLKAIVDFNKIKKERNKKKEKKDCKKYKLIILAVIAGVFISLLSPMSPISNKIWGTDSYVFQYGGMAIKNGLIPYKDFFDHKGIIIYFINFLGLLINLKYGIWIIETLLIIITIIYSQKIIAIFTKNKIINILGIILICSFLAIFFEGGNLVEEYAMPCIVISSYIFIDYLKNEKINNLKIISLGILFSIVCMLRINMVAIWPIFILTIIYKLIKEKKFKDLLKYIALFSIGLIIVFFPIFVYLIKNNAFKDFIEQYIIFNFKYSNVTMSEKYTSFKFFTTNAIFYISLLSVILSLKNKQKNITIANFITLICNIILMSISGRQYVHYEIINVPILVNSFAMLCETLENKEDEKLAKVILSLGIVYILIPNMYSYIDNLLNLKNMDNTQENKIVDIVKNNSNEKDRISVYGNSDYVYVLSNRLSNSKYSYQFPISDVDGEIFNEYIRSLENDPPKIVVVMKKPEDSELLINKLEEMKYKKIDEKIYIKD